MKGVGRDCHPAVKMKKLNDYKEEIHKCSKCGLCQSVCPVYKITGNDCSVSRGKFIMLGGILKGDLELNKNVNKYLDMCLKCNACKNFCPSDIDARKIFLTAKAEYFANGGANSKFLRILNSPLIFNLFMNCAKITINTYRFLKFDRFLKHFYSILLKNHFGKKIILINKFISINDVGQECPTYEYNLESRSGIIYPPARQPKALKIIYFEGCVNTYINPKTKNAVKNILKAMNVEILPAAFQCCGVPFLSGGNVEQFVKQAEFNLAQIPDEFDYLLTDCASCQNAFKEYENYIEDEKLLEKLRKINEKSVNVVDFIVKNAKSFEFDVEAHSKQNLNRHIRVGSLTHQRKADNSLNAPHKEKISFTFHKPCHLKDLSFLQEFLSKAKNVEYIEMKDFDKCCGFSGEFAMKNPEISQQISAEKIQNALETGADYILTSCPACLLGLNQGLIEAKEMENEEFLTLSFIEFLAQSKSTV